MILVTPDPVIPPGLRPKLGHYAQRKLAARGVEIVTGAKVRAIRAGAIALDWTLDLCFAKDFACVTDGPRRAAASRAVGSAA